MAAVVVVVVASGDEGERKITMVAKGEGKEEEKPEGKNTRVREINAKWRERERREGKWERESG